VSWLSEVVAMTELHNKQADEQLVAALAAPSASVRLRAALAAGSAPHADYVEALVERCRIEPDFYVRDMLTWALTRHDRETVIDRVVRELCSDVPQARSQALHTLSKLGAPRTWRTITTQLLQDADDEVARAAWRTAVGLVPTGEEEWLTEVLATQLGRGGRDLQRSLSRAFVALGSAAVAVIERLSGHSDEGVAAHAIATERLMDDPDEGFDAAIDEAKRTVALLATPRVEA
jgi:HEAT repeat protein